MRKLPLINVICLSDNDCFGYMKGYLEQYGNVVTDNENYLYLRRKDSKIMLVAHLDTVCGSDFKAIKSKRGGKKIYNVNGILGADDRAGVYSITDILQKSKINFDVLITNYEESGGIGVGVFCTDEVFEQADIRMFIELDRHGRNDHVEYNPIPDEVEEYIENFGFKSAWGSFSDIETLSDNYMIPSTNLSIGYFNEHTAAEELDIKAMNKTINRVLGMLSNPIDKLYPIDPNKGKYTKYGKYDWGNRYYDEFDMYGRCPECGVSVYYYEEICNACGHFLKPEYFLDSYDKTTKTYLSKDYEEFMEMVDGFEFDQAEAEEFDKAMDEYENTDEFKECM